MKAAHGEYRRHERTGLRLPVDIEVAGKKITTNTLNVSLSGLGLTPAPGQVFELNQLVTVRFRAVPGLSATAQVVYLSGDHVGLSLYKSRLSDRDIDLLIALAPKWQRMKIIARRSLWMHTRRIAILLANTVFRQLLIRLYRPRFLFAAYGTRKDAQTYFTPWMERILPPVLLLGVIRNGPHRGFMVASKYLEHELANNGENVRDYLNQLQEALPGMQRIALVGRLPNFVLKAGLPIQPPFVSGAMGTRYMIWDAARQMKALDAYRTQTTIVVLGGAGRIGNLVCEDLLSLYGTVIAFDKRYTEEEIHARDGGQLIRTASPMRLRQARLFIGLTHHGDVIQEWAAYIPPGSLIADDTHPCISLGVREVLASHQIATQKIVLTHQEFDMVPRMPAWSNRDIPGCLVEALVLLEHEDAVAENFGRFCGAAAQAGFQGRLVAPLDE